MGGSPQTDTTWEIFAAIEALTSKPKIRASPGTEKRMPVTADLDFKIAQMLMVGFRGLDIADDNPIVAHIRDLRIGGVFLFDYDVAASSPVRNIQSPRQVKALTSALQKLSPVPLLIGIDQEGGHILRLKEKFGFPPLVSAQYLGKLNKLDVTRSYAESNARTMAQAGINLNLAPVVDLNSNPDNPVIGKLGRSFSDDPGKVTTHAIEFIKAHHAEGILCALKHFPGHGSSKGDSHMDFVDVTKTWTPIELEPYKNIIAVGLADMVMTAHIFNEKLDAKYPATLSKPIITGILREHLGFDGVVISDDMQMDAIRKYFGLEIAIQKTIEAGVDIIGFGNNLVYELDNPSRPNDVAAHVIAMIKRWVEQGKVSEARIDDSYRRIQKLKQRLS
jgi:beta-N-acetylhexosaminidase